MEKRDVEKRLGGEIPRILAETTVVPVMEDGHVAGLALTRIPDGTLLSEAGLRAGDVLTEVNDTRIDGMATLIGLWPRLQNASELRAVVLRNGQPVSLSLTLR
jgi:type II secretory pathway component PulC